MPEFFVSNVRNSEHLGSVDITLSPVGPNTTSKIVITVKADEVYPKVGERLTVSLSPVTPEAKTPAATEEKAPEVSNG